MSLITPSPPIQPVSSTAAIIPNREGREQELRPEQVVRASVAEGGQDRVLLEMGHQRFWAQTRIPLRTGQSLNLQVLQTEPRLELRLLDLPLTERIGHALHALNGKFDILSLLTRLLEGRPSLPAAPAGGAGQGPAAQSPTGSAAQTPALPLPTASLPPAPGFSPPPAASGLPAAQLPTGDNASAQSSGTMLSSEKVMAQYRAAQPELGRWIEPPLAQLAERFSPGSRDTLLAFKSVLSDPNLLFGGAQLRQTLKHLGLHMEVQLAVGRAQDAAETLKSALLEARHVLQAGGVKSTQVDHLLQNLELHQLCNLRLAQDGALVWPLLLPFLDQGYLMVEERRHQRNSDQEPPWQLSLHLSLQALGDLRVEFLHEPQGLFLRFVCDNKEKSDFVSGFADELRRGITSVPLAGLSFSQGAESPAKTLIRRVLEDGEGVLNARV